VTEGKNPRRKADIRDTIDLWDEPGWNAKGHRDHRA